MREYSVQHRESLGEHWERSDTELARACRRRREDRGGAFVFAERDGNPCDGSLAVALGPDLWRQNVQASHGVARAIIDQRLAGFWQAGSPSPPIPRLQMGPSCEPASAAFPRPRLPMLSQQAPCRQFTGRGRKRRTLRRQLPSRKQRQAERWAHVRACYIHMPDAPLTGMHRPEQQREAFGRSQCAPCARQLAAWA